MRYEEETREARNVARLGRKLAVGGGWAQSILKSRSVRLGCPLGERLIFIPECTQNSNHKLQLDSKPNCEKPDFKMV